MTPPITHRLDLDSQHVLELSLVVGTGATLYVADSAKDAAVSLSSEQLADLKHAVSLLLAHLLPVTAPPGIRSETGKVIVEHVRQVMVALGELDKVASSEVDEILRFWVSHVRSSRAHVLREAL